MEKRTLLAIFLSLAILLSWNYFFVPQTPPEQTPKEPAKKEAPAVQKPAPAVPAAVPMAAPEPPSAQEVKPVVIETPLYRATWSTRGAALTSFQLKKYRETIDPKSKIVNVLTTSIPVVALSDKLDDSSLVFSRSGEEETATVNPREITFTAQAGPGVVIKKIYSIDPSVYTLGCRVVVENTTPGPLSVAMRISMDGRYPLDQENSSYHFEGPVLLADKHLEEFKLSKIEKAGQYRDFPGTTHWFGFEDKYFLKTIIPKAPVDTTLTVRRIDEKIVRIIYDAKTSSIQPGTSLVKEYQIFIGPKEHKTLKAVGSGLHKALDFGFFDIIAKPLLVAMNWIYKYTLSYGLTIIILTIIIKFLLYPLTLKSIKSMKELQKIQPLMKEVQAKYKDDKQKLNQELMKLYSEHKINPMGGCLPMLLQIPILFALYKVFYQAIELRHTPFHIFGTWLPDLAEKDPYYITPVLMGVSQFIMQKMSPSPGDEMQQKMMLIMPVVLTFLFVNFPSGLVLYWLVSNILSIFQQAYINKKHV